MSIFHKEYGYCISFVQAIAMRPNSVILFTVIYQTKPQDHTSTGRSRLHFYNLLHLTSLLKSKQNRFILVIPGQGLFLVDINDKRLNWKRFVRQFSGHGMAAFVLHIAERLAVSFSHLPLLMTAVRIASMEAKQMLAKLSRQCVRRSHCVQSTEPAQTVSCPRPWSGIRLLRFSSIWNFKADILNSLYSLTDTAFTGIELGLHGKTCPILACHWQSLGIQRNLTVNETVSDDLIKWPILQSHLSGFAGLETERRTSSLLGPTATSPSSLGGIIHRSHRDGDSTESITAVFPDNSYLLFRW